MGLIKARPIGYHPIPKPYKLPPRNPTSWQLLRAGIKRRLADGPIGRVARLAVERNIYIVGSNGPDCSIHPTATMANAIINASSGRVVVEEHVFLGHGVQLLAGTHDAYQTGSARKRAIPPDGHDIVIEAGAWVASNVTIVGPCTIGANAVVCAGAVVTKNVAPATMVGGIPARLIKKLDLAE